MKRALHLLLGLILILTLIGCTIQIDTTGAFNGDTPTGAKDITDTQSTPGTGQLGQLKVHFIDVGQADSILIQQDGENMLIDAGNNGDSDEVVKYLKNQGVKKLNYLVLTHPHEDHIGGADAVIDSFDIGTVYMPKVTATTKTFKDVIESMNKKGLKADVPSPGNSFKLGNASCLIVAPNSKTYEDINNYSIVIKLTFGSNSFLLTGDAQNLLEKEILDKGFDIKADVLKVGHHGSETSTSDTFLAKVNPKYAVISVGKDNDYNHPHKVTLDRLKNKGIKIYRTDEDGTIVAVSDGKSIIFKH